jgi:hypothetical protein
MTAVSVGKSYLADGCPGMTFSTALSTASLAFLKRSIAWSITVAADFSADC